MKKIIYLICFAGIAMQACNEKTAGDNPLLAKFDTPFQVPPFEKIHNAHYLPAFREGIKQQQKEIEAIVTNSEAPTFANTIEALEKSGQLLDRVNYIFINLQEANTNDSLKAIAEEIMPELTAHNDGIYLNEQLFERVKKVYEAQDKENLTTEQKMVLKHYYDSFVRAARTLLLPTKSGSPKSTAALPC